MVEVVEVDLEGLILGVVNHESCVSCAEESPLWKKKTSYMARDTLLLIQQVTIHISHSLHSTLPAACTSN